MEDPRSIDWSETLGKEARSKNDEDFGEVKEVTDGSILTERGIVEKNWFEIPKNEVYGFDGHTLWLDIPEARGAEFYRLRQYRS